MDTLTEDSLQTGISILTERDPGLKQVIVNYGHPPLWSREQGFPTLIRIILEQQVSLASAEAAFNKLNDAAAANLTPTTFLEFSDDELKDFGFSRQKANYGRELSKEIKKGNLDLESLQYLDDSDARRKLMSIKGIGPWTANIYLLMALLRPDVWPSGDLAVKKAIRDIRNMRETPDSDTADDIAQQWSPWRAVATRILWHHYLSDATE